MNPYKKWKRYHLNDSNIGDMELLFNEDQPYLYGGDTEATGLHIIRDKAFLIVCGWFIPDKDYGRVFTFEPTPTTMEVFLRISKEPKVNVWWNTKYDLHMMNNVGYPYNMPNLVEGMSLARAAFEAVPARVGGDSLKLKEVGVKYVDKEAARADNKLSEIKKR